MADVIEKIIAKSNQRLEENYRYLKSRNEYFLARDVDAVIVDLNSIKALHAGRIQQIVNKNDVVLMQKDDEIRSRSEELERQKSARRQAFNLAEERQLLLAEHQKTIWGQHQTIKSHEQSISTLQEALSKERKNAKDQYQQGYKKGLSDGDEARTGDVNEVLVETSLKQGFQAFESKNYKDARHNLLSAKKGIDMMNPDRRNRIDLPKLHYALAVSGAYVEDIEQAKASLSAYVRHTSAFANDEELLQVAHVQHLLAQVWIGCENLPEAIAACNSAFITRNGKLKKSDNWLHQTTALRCLIFEFEKKPRDASILRKTIPDGSRDVLQQMYASLKPLGKIGPHGNQLVAQSWPASQLLPVWSMATLKVAPVQPPKQAAGAGGKAPSVKPPQQTPATPLPVDIKYRENLLTELNLTTNPKQQLSWRLKQAIVTGNQRDVASRIDNGDHVGPPALHLAALFDELEIAKLLVERGSADVNGQCTCNSSKPGLSVYGVTPMHLAIGAQNVKLIRYLARKKGFFGRQKRHSAPPLWLLNERWLSKPGNDNPQKMRSVLETMQDCNWDTNARLNEDGKRMRDLAKTQLVSRPALQRVVLQFLA